MCYFFKIYSLDSVLPFAPPSISFALYPAVVREHISVFLA